MSEEDKKIKLIQQENEKAKSQMKPILWTILGFIVVFGSILVEDRGATSFVADPIARMLLFFISFQIAMLIRWVKKGVKLLEHNKE